MTCELVIDSFAGGGGASLGLSRALGREPDVAINHDASAIEMHRANHPRTKHYTEDVWKVRPQDVTRGRPVGLLWASPDCKHFSRAKGGKPVSKNIRSLAWVVVRWALACRPRVIILENVREFADWGPLGEDDRPCPRRKGLTFRRFVGRLRGLGYRVEWRVLDAADFGAPTQRRRLFLIARCDGQPVCWPEPTHGDPAKIGKGLFDRHLLPWRTAAECIDWSIPCPSIFERKRPLAEATLRRIAMGIKRYVLDNPRPFLVVCNHGGPEFRGGDVGSPLPTVTAARDAHGVVAPCLMRYNSETSPGDNRTHSLGDPLNTIVSENRFAVVAPCLARIGQTGGNGKYANSAAEPVTAITSEAEHLLVAPYLVPRYGERPGQEARTGTVEAPIGAVTPKANCGTLVAAFLAKHYGGVVGVRADTPLPTTTARGTQNQVVAASLVHLNHGEKQWSGCDDPMRTATTGNHAALVYSFLTTYNRTAVGSSPAEPLRTVTANDRFGLVTVTLDGEPYVIVDIGMRMLRPRELARGQGFPDSYVLTGSATSQVAKIGNSVAPVMAEVLCRANYGQAGEREAV